MIFPVVMYGCESWTIKKAKHQRIDAFELWCWRRLLRVPWTDLKEIKAVNSKGNQSWILIGRTDAEAPILCPPDANSQLTGKDPDAEKDWRLEEKGVTEDEMNGWHHQLNGHEFEQTLGDSEGQGSLACSSPGGCKKLDTTEWLSNNNNLSSGCRSFLYSPNWHHYTSSEIPTPACWHLLPRGLRLSSAETSSELQGHWHLPASASSSGIWVLAPWESLFGAQRFK